MKVNSRWWIIIILALALGLRLINLNQSLWLDEAIEWWAVTAFDLRQLLLGFMKGDFNPPLHYLVMWFWVRIFGDSEIALRMPSVIFGVGTVWFIYKIANLIRPGLATQGRAFPELAAMMAAVNGLLIYYSQEARMYAMAAFFVTGAMYFFMRRNYFLYFAFMAGALYSHYLTWLMFPVVAIWGIRFLVPWLITIPWWPILWQQLQVGMSAAKNPVWAEISKTSWLNISLVSVKFVTGRVPFPDLLIYQIVTILIVIVFWLMVYLGSRLIWSKTSNKSAERVIIYWALIPTITAALIGIFIPVFTYFRLLFVLPAVLILAAIGADKKWFITEVIVIFMMLTGFVYLAGDNFHRENWQKAIAELKRKDPSPTVLIHPAVRPPFDYYDRGRSHVVDTSSLHPLSLIPYPSIWYIPYAQPIFDQNDLTRKYLINNGYARDFEKHFRGVTLEKWKI